VFIASRLEYGVLARKTAGTVYGWPAWRPRALLHVGSNLAPAGPLEAIGAFVEVAGRHRGSQSIMGESAMVLPFWEALCKRWGKAYSQVREVRPSQPLMTLVGEPSVPGSPEVRELSWNDYDSYLEAAKAMYSEEVGPLPPGDGYAGYCRWLISNGNAYGVVHDGKVIFKADVGTSALGVGQIQGVWLEPSLRGRGLSIPYMAAAATLALRKHPTLSLYVNDFNLPAISCYRHIGFKQVGELATVLY
jgi:predicted GNAT family acetyltransferase